MHVCTCVCMHVQVRYLEHRSDWLRVCHPSVQAGSGSVTGTHGILTRSGVEPEDLSIPECPQSWSGWQKEPLPEGSQRVSPELGGHRQPLREPGTLAMPVPLTTCPRNMAHWVSPLSLAG